MGIDHFKDGFQLEMALENYTKPRQFMQNVFGVFDERMRQPLVYIRNHKSACTTVLLSLWTSRWLMDGKVPPRLTIEQLHNRPFEVFFNPGAAGRLATFAMIQSRAVMTFSIVRNPLERAASAYADKVVGSARYRSRINLHLGRPRDAEISFHDFIHALSTDTAFGNLDRHWRPQHLELSCDTLFYDYIGALEHLDEDLPAITRHCFGEADAGFGDARKAFGHKTRSAELIGKLSVAEKQAFEDKFEADYALYERALGKRFADLI